jgi:hypothetical protein
MYRKTNNKIILLVYNINTININAIVIVAIAFVDAKLLTLQSGGNHPASHLQSPVAILHVP